VRGDR